MQKVSLSVSFSSKERTLATAAICLSAFMVILDLTIANVALPYIAGDLGADAAQAIYIITFFAVGNALGLSLTGWLAKRFSLINTLTIAIALFVIFSVLCGLSQTLLQIVLFRFFQGLCTGPIIPLSQNCLRLLFEKSKIDIAISIFSTIVLVAPVFGPIIGGILCVTYSWPWIFFINVPIGIFCFFVIDRILKPINTAKENIPLDTFGFLSLCLGAICLQIILDKGQQWNWFASTAICTLAVLSFLGYIFFYVHCLIHKKALFTLRLFKTTSYTISVILLFCVMGCYIGIVVLVPYWLQVYMGYNAYSAGIAVSSIGVIPIFFSMLIPKLMKKIGVLFMIVIGMLAMALSCFVTMEFTSQVDIMHVSFSRFLVGFALVFWITPIFKLAMWEVEAKDLPHGLGMLHFFRALGAGIGASIAMVLFRHRMIVHHSNILQRMDYTTPIHQQFLSCIRSLGMNTSKTNALVEKVVEKQAAMLAFNDVFFLFGFVFVLLAFLVLLCYPRIGHFR